MALRAPRTSDRIRCSMEVRRLGGPRHPRQHLLQQHHCPRPKARQAILATTAAVASAARAAAVQGARAARRTSAVLPWWARTWRRHTTARTPRWRRMRAQHPCTCMAHIVLVIADQEAQQMRRSSLSAEAKILTAGAAHTAAMTPTCQRPRQCSRAADVACPCRWSWTQILTCLLALDSSTLRGSATRLRSLSDRWAQWQCRPAPGSRDLGCLLKRCRTCRQHAAALAVSPGAPAQGLSRMQDSQRHPARLLP